MKNKIHSILITLGLVFIIAPAAYASPITGTAYGENIGFLHFDYSTAKNPFDGCVNFNEPDPLTPNCPLHADYSKYHLGLRESFYISPADASFDTSEFMQDWVASIGDIGEGGTDCDNGLQVCFLKGFIWSDEIGWIALYGPTIQASIIASDDDVTEDNIDDYFPASNFAKISYNGVMSGYIWSEKTGWIRLASDSFDPNITPQNADNYGVWMDPLSPDADPLLSTDCEGKTEVECDDLDHICIWNEGACTAQAIARGHALQGHVWSEKLGWIKFHAEGGDFHAGAYTTWVPDTTPPELNVIEDNLWFANNSDTLIIPWPDFTSDPESPVDKDETKFFITSETAGCGDGLDDFEVTSPPWPSTNKFNEPAEDLNILDLGLLLGDVSTSATGYCKYQLYGKLVNTAGLTYYIGDPTGDTDPYDKPDEVTDPDHYSENPITFFVRAGDYYADNTTLENSTALGCKEDNIIADGVDCYELRFKPVDIAGNPIVPVKVSREGVDKSAEDPSTWMREAKVKFFFESDAYFDEVSKPPPSWPSYVPPHPVPISFDGIELVSQINDASVIYPFNVDAYVYPTVGEYPVQISSFAPIAGGFSSNNFEVNKIEIDTRESAMPPITKPPTEGTPAFDGDPIAFTEFIQPELAFHPAIEIATGLLTPNTVTLAVPNIALYEVTNNSPTEDIEHVAIDNRLYFENAGGTGFGFEVLDMRDIKLLSYTYYDADLVSSGNSGTFTDDTFNGRTDPVHGKTRYLVFNDTDVQDTPFHDEDTNFHSESYEFNFNGWDFTASPLLSSAQYEVDGIYDLTDEEKAMLNDPELDPPFTYPPISIDRNDVMPLFKIGSGGTEDFSIQVNSNQYMGVEPTEDVLFGIKQYVAYQMPDSPIDLYTIYEAPPRISGIEVKSIGVQTTGIVTGEHVYETVKGRDLETVTPTDAGELKRQIRNNVADITRNMDLSSCGSTTLSALPVSGDCVKADTVNNTTVAVYEGDVTLDGNIDVPAGAYTLILKGGADLYIKGNILPGVDNISFGIIALADENGDGGNVYIDPAPTNIAALLYAEGSLISRDGVGDCYGGGTVCDLGNQLYWQGSIVSRNTIGGAPKATLPAGVTRDDDCPTTDAFTCAQKYDLDYIRRFSVNNYDDGTYSGGYVPDTTTYSGGNTCTDATPPVCGDTEPTTILLNSDSLIDKANSKSVDPFFIEKDNRPAPPGFETTAGFERTIEVR